MRKLVLLLATSAAFIGNYAVAQDVNNDVESSIVSPAVEQQEMTPPVVEDEDVTVNSAASEEETPESNLADEAQASEI